MGIKQEARRYPYFRELSPEHQRQVKILMIQDEAAGRDPADQHVSEYIPIIIDQSRSLGRATGGKVKKKKSVGKVHRGRKATYNVG